MDVVFLVFSAILHALALGFVLYLMIRLDTACDRIKELHGLYANKSTEPLHVNAMSKENEGN